MAQNNRLLIEFTEPTDIDRDEYTASGFRPGILEDRVKVVVTDDDFNCDHYFLDTSEYHRFGEDYIREHTTLEWNQLFNEYRAHLDCEPFYNDIQRYPERVVPLEFKGLDERWRYEVYLSKEDKRRYIRIVSSREPHAKWLIGGYRRMEDEGDEPRANLVFEHNGQTERVTFKSSAGVGAYEDTYNPNFRGTK